MLRVPLTLPLVDAAAAAAAAVTDLACRYRSHLSNVE